MRLLHKLVSFGVPQQDLKMIYILYIRSHLEQSCQVWHSSLTLDNVTDLERVQKNALRIILQENYQSYSHALEVLALDSLYDSRVTLCLLFAKKCLKSKNSKVSSTLCPEKNAPQFLLNISGYKHPRRLGHISFERRHP